MIQMRNKVLMIILSLVLVFLVAGCGKENKKTAVTQEEGMKLYFLNTDENGLKEVACTLENTNDPLAASYEVTSHLSDKEELKTGSYKVPIYDGILINDITLENGMETVDFGSSYMQLSSEREILLRSAVVKSLMGIDGVDAVSFTINGEDLLGADDVPVGPMTEKSFLFNLDTLYTQEKEVTLYYANMEGNRLVPVKTKVRAEDNVPLEMAILQELMKRPEKENLQSPLPDNVSINHVQIYNNVCYVDLSPDIESVMPVVNEKIKIYAMVNSVISAGNASQVQFTINGRREKKLNDFTSFDKLITSDYSFCEKEN